MNNVFDKRKPLNRATPDRFKPYRDVKHFKACAFCGKQIDSKHKDNICLSCDDVLTIAQIEQDRVKLPFIFYIDYNAVFSNSKIKLMERGLKWLIAKTIENFLNKV